MRFMKKFGALALATVAVATSVWFVTPALQALAGYVTGQRLSYVEGSGSYEPDSNGKYVQDGDSVRLYTEWAAEQQTPNENNTNNPSTPVDAVPAPSSVVPSTVVDASPSSSSSSSSSSSAAVPAPVKVVAPNGQTLLQYTAIGAKNTLMAAPEGIVPQGAILAQYEVKEDSQTYEVAKTILGLRVPNATLAKVLDFNLSAKQGTLIHQLNGRVAISFDIPANFTVPAGYVPRVYRFNDNGTVTACETILDKGKVVFGTDHFSTFALVLEKAPKAAKAK